MKISGDPSIMNAINFSILILVWSLSNGWIIYQCSIKPKMIVTRILSANLFKPLSRLSFSLYLSHLMTIWFFAHQVRQPISLVTWTDLIRIVSTTFSAAFVIGYLLHLTFEAPTIGLLLLFFKDKKLLKTLRSFDHRTNFFTTGSILSRLSRLSRRSVRNEQTITTTTTNQDEMINMNNDNNNNNNNFNNNNKHQQQQV